MKNNLAKGKMGEEIAKKHLISKGYQIINMNFKCKIGEIDLIALDNDILVFIEVKLRTSLKYGHAYEAVNRKKQQKIINSSYVYMNIKHLNELQTRYDIIEVYLMSDVKINHIVNAFY